jgi:hypothetical protein
MDLPYSTSTSSWQEHHYHCWKEQCKRILHWRFQQLATADLGCALPAVHGEVTAASRVCGTALVSCSGQQGQVQEAGLLKILLLELQRG